MSKKLKPCPFCGGKAQIREETPDTMMTEYVGFYIRCSNVACIAHDVFRPYTTKQKAIEAWNRRFKEDC